METADPFTIPETEEERNINFIGLCQEFIMYYNNFIDDFSKSTYNGRDTCYVTFGISGAGKVS